MQLIMAHSRPGRSQVRTRRTGRTSREPVIYQPTDTPGARRTTVVPACPVPQNGYVGMPLVSGNRVTLCRARDTKVDEVVNANHGQARG